MTRTILKCTLVIIWGLVAAGVWKLVLISQRPTVEVTPMVLASPPDFVPEESMNEQLHAEALACLDPPKPRLPLLGKRIIVMQEPDGFWGYENVYLGDFVHTRVTATSLALIILQDLEETSPGTRRVVQKHVTRGLEWLARWRGRTHYDHALRLIALAWRKENVALHGVDYAIRTELEQMAVSQHVDGLWTQDIAGNLLYAMALKRIESYTDLDCESLIASLSYGVRTRMRQQPNRGWAEVWGLLEEMIPTTQPLHGDIIALVSMDPESISEWTDWYKLVTVARSTPETSWIRNRTRELWANEGLGFSQLKLRPLDPTTDTICRFGYRYLVYKLLRDQLRIY